MALFKILLGTSEDGSDHSSLTEWRKKADHTIEVHKNDQGALFYLTGEFESPYAAKEYLQQLKDKGLDPIDYVPVINGHAIPKGWMGKIEIGQKQSEIVPDPHHS